jgi:hypothetical protein
MKNKDQKSLESIYESIKIVNENEEDYEGGASFEGEGKDMGSIDGVTPDVSDYSEGEEEGDIDLDDEGLLSAEGLDELLRKVEAGNDIRDEQEGEAPEDVQSDFEEEGLK